MVSAPCQEPRLKHDRPATHRLPPFGKHAFRRSHLLQVLLLELGAFAALDPQFAQPIRLTGTEDPARR